MWVTTRTSRCRLEGMRGKIHENESGNFLWVVRASLPATGWIRVDSFEYTWSVYTPKRRADATARIVQPMVWLFPRGRVERGSKKEERGKGRRTKTGRRANSRRVAVRAIIFQQERVEDGTERLMIAVGPIRVTRVTICSLDLAKLLTWNRINGDGCFLSFCRLCTRSTHSFSSNYQFPFTLPKTNIGVETFAAINWQLRYLKGAKERYRFRI